jgi:hypothetical protein
VIDAAADDEEIDGIVGGLSSGKQAMLYSALHYTESRLHEPASAEQQKGNRLRALRILRELLFWEPRDDQYPSALKARAATRFRDLVAQGHKDALTEDKARHEAKVANMHELRARRLARDRGKL